MASLFSIGHGLRTAREFTDLLRHHRVQYLVDVRTFPYSKRNPQFSQRDLRSWLQAANIRYAFMGDILGGRPTDPFCYRDGKVDYDKLSQTSTYQKGILRLQKAFQQGLCLVVMCSEGKPEVCHRSKLIGLSLSNLRIPLTHIDENGELKSQAEVVSLIQRRQPQLFDAFTDHLNYSLKRYQTDEPDDVR